RLTCHRAAEWSIRRPDDVRLAVLAEEGFECDASVMPVPPLGAADNPPGPYRLFWEGASLLEIPALTGRGFGRPLPMGGGWPFRMFSLERIAAAENRFRDAGWPAVFTFHPWEFDPEHPSLVGLSAIGRLVHFYNLGAVPDLFEKWLRSDRTVTLGEACDRLGIPAAA